MRLLLFASFVLSIAAVAQPPRPTVQLPPELSRVLAGYEDAWTAKDSRTLARLFTDDGYVLASGNPIVQGRAAIEQFYAHQGGPLSLHAVSYAMSGRVAFIIGTFSKTPEGPDLGKFTLTLQKDDAGRWRIFSDMNNGNATSRQ